MRPHGPPWPKGYSAGPAQRLLPLFTEGAEGMAALREEARRLGIVMSTEDAAAAAEFTDSMNTLKKALTGIQFAIGSAVIPELTLYLDALTDAGVAIRDFRDLFTRVFRFIVRYNDIANDRD